MQKPTPHSGLRHVALHCSNLDDCKHFYVELLGMKVVWQPDPDNIYLSSGSDNLALHRAPADYKEPEHQRLDHIGFFLQNREDVNAWHEYLRDNGVTIKADPKDHRDNTRSFYCADPDGNTVQMIYIPPEENAS